MIAMFFLVLYGNKDIWADVNVWVCVHFCVGLVLGGVAAGAGGWHRWLNRRVGVYGTRTWPGMRFTRRRLAGGRTAAGGRQVCFRLVFFAPLVVSLVLFPSCTVSRLYLVRMLQAHASFGAVYKRL